MLSDRMRQDARDYFRFDIFIHQASRLDFIEYKASANVEKEGHRKEKDKESVSEKERERERKKNTC